MLTSLRTAKETMDKHRSAIKEDFPLSDYIQAPVPSIEIERYPFPHIIVDNFFTQDFYRQICNSFRAVLDKGLNENDDKTHLHKFPAIGQNKLKYDAYFWVLDPECGNPLNFFYSPGWDEFVSGIFRIPSSKDTIAAFHHHKAGSESGWPHNDYSLCSFQEDRLENGINPWYYQCLYEDDSPNRQPDTLKRMRSIALMVYLANDEGWEPGDGGETGLYSSQNLEDIQKKIEPHNNRLFAFEISPKSFHGFLQNKKFPRNTLIQWLHQEPSSMFKKFGAYKAVPWSGY